MTYPDPREVESAVRWLEGRVRDSCDRGYPALTSKDREALHVLFAYVALTTEQANRGGSRARVRLSR